MDRIHPPTRGLRPPRAAHHFMGRDSELVTLIDALRSGQSILLSGIGGSGKTELLLQALGRCETGRTVFWCDVDQYPTNADMVSALRAAVGSGGAACTDDELPLRLDAVQACIVLDGIEAGSLEDLDSFEDTIKALFQATNDVQFVFTSQIVLHNLPTEARVRLGRLDESASRSLLYRSHEGARIDTTESANALLAFCDGHVLTLWLAGALAEHYGSATGALHAIHRHGVQSVRLPARKRQSRRTSLELCLQIAYDALAENSRQLLWALAHAPAGMATPYIDLPWLELADASEALASLKRWHLVDVLPVDHETGRTRLLTPVRQFAIERGRKEEPESFERIVGRVVQGFGMMVSVLELKYDKPEDIPHVLQRYGEELPNLLHVLNLARERPHEEEIVMTAVSIVRSLMRYFFVLRLPEQGARVICDAAELALQSLKLEQASGLALQLVALASRAGDASLIEVGMDIAGRVEAMTAEPEVMAEVAMCRATAAHAIADFPNAELHARKALNAYESQLLALEDSASAVDRGHFVREQLHNDLASALGMLGFALLSQGKYGEAAEAYRNSLQHQRGGSIAVNPGQMLHQIGNCESNLGNHKVAIELYIEAARIFDFVGMEEYRSNALGELGYSLLEIDMPTLSGILGVSG